MAFTVIWITTIVALVGAWVWLHRNERKQLTADDIAAELRAVCRETNRELDRQRLNAVVQLPRRF